MQNSLQSRLTFLWASTLIISLAICAIMGALYFSSADAQIHAARQATASACAKLQAQFSALSGDLDGREGSARYARLEALLQAVLRDYPGVEGGFWDAGHGFAAYAFPTYEGSGVKRDMPEAEQSRIKELIERSVLASSSDGFVQQGRREALLVQACPVRNGAAWTMSRVSHSGIDVYRQVVLGLAVLLSFVLLSGLWLGRTFTRWNRELARLESSLSGASLSRLPTLPLSGERELDRIVEAVNHLGTRLAQEHANSERLTTELARAQRLGALGKLASGLAHEIRNPIAAVRLKAENALAQEPGRERNALAFALQQISRLERLLSGMLSLTQAIQPTLKAQALEEWARARLDSVQGQASAARIDLGLDMAQAPGQWTFDADHLGRAVENLLLNAIAHTPAGGRVVLGAAAGDGTLTLSVTDSGCGVSPEVREQVFDPFFTGREDGVGLGLAQVRAAAEAHGGTARCVPHQPGARFELEIPWRES